MHHQRGGEEFTLKVRVLGPSYEQEVHSDTVEVAYREIYTETVAFTAPQSPQVYRVVATAASPAGEELGSHEAPLVVA
ncbi:MAG TPA: hypothetical protein VN282_05605 [Pyrinomonadaceae bacterium]|nr:hypothetical protein [Pyrinomonadaceae bacterium]